MPYHVVSCHINVCDVRDCYHAIHPMHAYIAYMRNVSKRSGHQVKGPKTALKWLNTTGENKLGDEGPTLRRRVKLMSPSLRLH